MKKQLIVALSLLATASYAGPAGFCGGVRPSELPAPVGHLSLGSQFSEDLSGIEFDALLGLWSPASHDAFLFLDGRYHYEDNGQAITNLGLGYRQILPGQEVIVGANIFWDNVHSEHGNDLDQLGLGVEVLTRWVDARFNYYIPEDDQFTVSSRSVKSTRQRFVPGGILSTTTTAGFARFETGLEGFNAEVGFLIPGSEAFAESRIFAGYYHYDNPFGSDFDGFKARLETRLLKGVTANVEYWDDKALMGGHWTAGVAVTVPFDLGKLFSGRNPFEGASESFQRVSGRFSDRLSERVERSHRVQTTTSGEIPTGSSFANRLRFFPRGNSQGGGGSQTGAGGAGFPLE